MLSLTLQLVKDGIISLPEAISRVTFNPACILGIDVGKLSIGAAADICIFDPDALREVSVSEFSSQGRNHPLDRTILPGSVSHVFVAGIEVRL